MQNPIRTLLYGLFVEPVARFLQAMFDWFGKANSVVTSNPKRSSAGAVRSVPSYNPISRDARSHWEKMGILAPVYRLISLGVSDHQIAVQLNITENTVYGCTGYLMDRLKCRSRAELARYASPQREETWSLRSTPIMLVSAVRRWRQRRLARTLISQ
jgi:hypothetical protein